MARLRLSMESQPILGEQAIADLGIRVFTPEPQNDTLKRASAPSPEACMMNSKIPVQSAATAGAAVLAKVHESINPDWKQRRIDRMQALIDCPVGGCSRKDGNGLQRVDDLFKHHHEAHRI
jgi:hypothetical protein